MTKLHANAGAGMAAMTSARATAMGLALTYSLAGAAYAGERLVMPYVCTSLGGAVELDPSEPRSYPIIGRRDQDMVTSCSPADPNRCKTWRVHRFDIDCGGDRVPWVSVVAAASEMTGGPAYMRQGRMFVQMEPWWAPRRPPRNWGPPGRWTDDPTYGFDRPRAFDRWKRTRYARGSVVEMPPGFAPAIGIAARFVEGPGPVAGPGGFGDDFEAGPAEREAPPPRAAMPPPPLPKPAREDTTRQVEPKPATTAGPEKPSSAPEPKSEPKQTAVAEVTPKPEPKPGPKPASEAAKAGPSPAPANAAPISTGAINTTGTSVAPRIINRPEADASLKPADAPAAGAPPVVVAAEELPPDAHGAMAKQETTVVADAKSTTPDASGIPVTISETGPLASPSLQVLLSVAAVVLVTMTIFAWMRRGDHSRLATGGGRDLGAVSLGGSARTQASTGSTLTASRALTTAAAPGPIVSAGPELPGGPPHSPPIIETQAGVSVADDWLPKTREEALQVLGASPDASFESLKKIADGLRQSWHPDLARNEVDRIVRERRMKQINVAWELIQRAA